MKVIEVARAEIPQDWTEDHLHILQHGHEPGVVQEAQTGIAGNVLAFASGHRAGATIFGGFTFVDVSPGGYGPVRFEIH